jgi:hypothetical protein
LADIHIPVEPAAQRRTEHNLPVPHDADGHGPDFITHLSPRDVDHGLLAYAALEHGEPEPRAMDQTRAKARAVYELERHNHETRVFRGVADEDSLSDFRFLVERTSKNSDGIPAWRNLFRHLGRMGDTTWHDHRTLDPSLLSTIDENGDLQPSALLDTDRREHAEEIFGRHFPPDLRDCVARGDSWSADYLAHLSASYHQ